MGFVAFSEVSKTDAAGWNCGNTGRSSAASRSLPAAGIAASDIFFLIERRKHSPVRLRLESSSMPPVSPTRICFSRSSSCRTWSNSYAPQLQLKTMIRWPGCRSPRRRSATGLWPSAVVMTRIYLLSATASARLLSVWIGKCPSSAPLTRIPLCSRTASFCASRSHAVTVCPCCSKYAQTVWPVLPMPNTVNFKRLPSCSGTYFRSSRETVGSISRCFAVLMAKILRMAALLTP